MILSKKKSSRGLRQNNFKKEKNIVEYGEI